VAAGDRRQFAIGNAKAEEVRAMEAKKRATDKEQRERRYRDLQARMPHAAPASDPDDDQALERAEISAGVAEKEAVDAEARAQRGRRAEAMGVDVHGLADDEDMEPMKQLMGAKKLFRAIKARSPEARADDVLSMGGPGRPVAPRSRGY
jgi:hypothetical protein